MPSVRQKKKLQRILAEALAHFQASSSPEPTIGSRVFEREFYMELVASNGSIVMDHAMICRDLNDHKTRADNPEVVCKKAVLLGERYRAMGGTAGQISEESLIELNAELASVGFPFQILK
jgi:hypothetical protein